MIGERIRQARLAAGLTLEALGAELGVTHTAIQKYEKGAMTPPSSQLLKLAQACGVRVEYFFRTQEVELLDTEFRRLSSFGKTAQEALKIKVAEQLEKRIELFGYFPELPVRVFQSPGKLPRRINVLDDLEAFAEQVRETWRLGFDPIVDLTDTLETLGLLVLIVDEANPGFSGMTATARTSNGQTFPVVAVSSQWPGDRQRFTLAHELGHLLLSGRLARDIDEEKACDRFAGSFLAPKAAVLQLMGRSRRGIEWQELLALKHEFGLSMAGWLQRARQCEIISEKLHLNLGKRFSARGWRKTEPGPPLRLERPSLFEQLVYRALGEQYISESKAAELLGIPLMRFHKERELEFRDVVAHQ